ncbi:MAG: DUF58 domain-containing protein [Chloroflexota bacterium]
MLDFLSQRRTIVFFLAVASFVAGLLTGRDLLFTIAYLLGLLLIVSFAWAWANLNWLHLSRLTRTRRTQVGRPLEERFTLENTSIIPKLWVEVRDFSSLPDHYASRVVNGLGPHQSFSWRVTTMCRLRGRYQLGPIRLRTSDPFGLFPMERDILATSNVVVYPMTFEIDQFALPVGVLPGGDALRRRTHYTTTNAAGVRDYEPGDSFSRIHWRSSARRDRLIVKEFELDPLADIWIVPDMSVYGQISPRKDSASQAILPGDVRPGCEWRSSNSRSPPKSTLLPLPPRWPNSFFTGIGQSVCWPMGSRTKSFSPTGASVSLTAFWRHFLFCALKGMCPFRICCTRSLTCSLVGQP